MHCKTRREAVRRSILPVGEHITRALRADGTDYAGFWVRMPPMPLPLSGAEISLTRDGQDYQPVICRSERRMPQV